jgi:3-oxoacyl-[acyl-carrier-protein] synthase-1
VTIYISEYGITSPLGFGLDETRKNLFSSNSPGMSRTDKYSPGRDLFLGQVICELPELPNTPVKHQSRNNQLLLASFNQIEDRFSQLSSGIEKNRIAVIIGSSTSGISDEEEAFPYAIQNNKFPISFDLAQRLFCSPANFLAERLGILGPTYGISTACTSSAKAIISGARLLKSGMVDLVIAGGVDTLCKFTIAGFTSIESISENRCNPLSLNRSGINIGEGSALFILSREPGLISIAGWGESSDGYHISAPDPDGGGGEIAIKSALSMAKKQCRDVAYINLHGTGTTHNDSMESRLIARMGFECAVSSTKALTGHSLGAAGAIEAALSCLTLDSDGYLPPHVWDEVQDPALPQLNLSSRLPNSPKVVMSNNFAFGGNNTSLILERV